MMNSMRGTLKNAVHLFKPAWQVPRRHLYQQFKMAKVLKETKNQSCQRIQAQVLEALQKQRQCLILIMTETRIARPDETVANAAKRHTIETLDEVGLGMTEPRVFPGHCAVAYINEKGEMLLDQTFSLRADLNQPLLYKAETAPDSRLPSFLTMQPTVVRPAIHSSIEREIRKWAEDAFYANYVHPGRPAYPLHCFTRQLNSFDKELYFKEVKALKASSQRYSLLDHYHGGKLVASENCTLAFQLLAWMAPFHNDLKKILGDNPTPQWGATILGEQFTNQANDRHLPQQNWVLDCSGQELNRPYLRQSAS